MLSNIFFQDRSMKLCFLFRYCQRVLTGSKIHLSNTSTGNWCFLVPSRVSLYNDCDITAFNESLPLRIVYSLNLRIPRENWQRFNDPSPRIFDTSSKIIQHSSVNRFIYYIVKSIVLYRINMCDKIDPVKSVC